MKRKKGVVWPVAAVLAVCVGFLFAAQVRAETGAETAKEGKAAVISANKQIAIEYTLTLADKTVVDTNVGGKPLTYVQGAHQIIPGLEKALQGLHVGDRKKVVVQAADGYGEVHKEAFLEVDKKQLPPDALHVGAQIQGRAQDGRPLRGRVEKIGEKTVLLDFNHPLAGKVLYFDVKVLDIK